MTGRICGCLGFLLWLGGCSGSKSGAQIGDSAASSDDTSGSTDDTGSSGTFVPAEVPQPITESTRTDAPVYVWLFTHTEDHINHTPSEQRYTTIGPMVSDIDAAYPDAEIVWNIQFQGADALTVVQRDGLTGVATLLQSYASDGLVAFGYHGQHDPTEMNRPQRSLDDTSTWEEIVDAIDGWVSCERDPYVGGCVEDTGGGITAVSALGDVRVVSGATVPEGPVGFEGGAGQHAIRRQLPDRTIGLGFSAHAPRGDIPNIMEIFHDVAAMFTPAVDTSGTVFWMDDSIRIHDGDRTAEGLDAFGMVEGDVGVSAAWDAIDRSRPHVWNAAIASKYIYTNSDMGVSPTQYAYSNPTDPEFPLEYLNVPDDISVNYANTWQSLEFLAGTAFVDNPGSRFVGPDALIELVAPAGFWEVTSDELDVIARWLLLEWDGRPPPYVFDGVWYYSLRDAFTLLARAIADGHPDAQTLTSCYGPLDGDATSTAPAATVSGADLTAMAVEIAAVATAESTEWETTPPNILPSDFAVSSADLNAAQALYGMAMVVASTHAGTPVTAADIPASLATPESFELIEQLNCITCAETSWSLKPARIQEL